MFCSSSGLAPVNLYTVQGQPPALENHWLNPKGIKVSKIVTKVACVNIKGGTVTECVNTPCPVKALTKGVVAKIPVVLAQLMAQVNVDATIDFPQPAVEIKKIDNRLKVTQCLLLQNTDMLTMEGFVRQNINYATFNYANREGACGDIRHCTVDIPFKCVTRVAFNGTEPLPVIPAETTEFEYHRIQEVSGPGCPDKDKLLAGHRAESNRISTEYFNELPFGELISSRIVQFEEHLNPVRLGYYKAPVGEKPFKRLEEKMVIFLALIILQSRQVAIPASEWRDA